MTISVTDHAVLRYIQRIKGFDVEAVRLHIANVCKGVTLARTVRAENHDFIISNGCVVTVKPHGAVNRRKVPRGRGDR